MLAGQEIGFLDTLMITAFGMIISMVAMILLWWFVVILSKAVAWKESKEKPLKVVDKSKEGLSEAILKEESFSAMDVSEAEIASIIGAVGASLGLSPDQYKIKSISNSYGGQDVGQEEVAAIVAAISAREQVCSHQLKITSITPKQ